jgi:peptide/nickel transport system ATP-binding protein
MIPVFTAEHICLEYRTRTGEVIPAVDDVSFTLNRGDILGIAGESGCGKSTLMWGCMNLCRPPLCFSSGDVIINGTSLRSIDPHSLRHDVHGVYISLIPQGAINALNPTCKIGDLAADMLSSHDHTISKKKIQDRLHERFTYLGLDADRVLASYPFALSGGMRQRVVIGISTLLNPQVVIADEPTSALDVTSQKAVLDLLLRLVEENIIDSMILITHELPLLLHRATKVAVMYAGQFVETGPCERIMRAPRHPYSRSLIDSMSEPLSDTDITPVLPDVLPSNNRPSSGCRFASRCPDAGETCTRQHQPLISCDDSEVRCSHV